MSSFFCNTLYMYLCKVTMAPLNIGKLAHAGVPGSNPGEAEL